LKLCLDRGHIPNQLGPNPKLARGYKKGTPFLEDSYGLLPPVILIIKVVDQAHAGSD
jgi:hypothetical protein